MLFGGNKKKEIGFIQVINMFFKKNYIILRGLSTEVKLCFFFIRYTDIRDNQAYLIKYIQKLFLRDAFGRLLRFQMKIFLRILLLILSPKHTL